VQASAGARDGGEEWRAPSRPSSTSMRPDTDSVELFPTLGGGGGGGGGGKVRQQVGTVCIEHSSCVGSVNILALCPHVCMAWHRLILSIAAHVLACTVSEAAPRQCQ
jgi:hypothetical protein